MMQMAPLDFCMQQPWFYQRAPEIILSSSGQTFKDTNSYAFILMFRKHKKHTKLWFYG